MKKILLSALAFSTILACSGSETYRGAWKATDANGDKFDITFDAEHFVIRDQSGKKANFEYSQNSVNISNSIETYGIQLGDGRAYKINFPVADDETIGVITDGNGQPLYTIDRDEYKRYEEIYRLQ
ncbi:hypothetical protein [Flavobacterium selenitireducens]|uniref:hypothetical protein n=1 Tax=Flavobacterium selenitireducens TaxID=2722704 RepID=UPI00168A8220|nr:hypothetical protein [Flavobacterium selenitireducens]MBD3583928.1 hypothetical protein [Flavobacterium selenitireducens]